MSQPNCSSSVCISATSGARVPLFFFNDTATTEIYTLSLHDALPICWRSEQGGSSMVLRCSKPARSIDRKSTRLNSSHGYISYAVFCLKKQQNTDQHTLPTYYQHAPRSLHPDATGT